MDSLAWPDDRAVAVVFNIAYESWSAGRAPALGPMGNPLPPGVPDLQAASWGKYGRGPGIRRLVDVLETNRVKATVMVSGVLAEQAPETLQMLADRGHDLCAHGYSQDILPGALTAEDERQEIARCRDLLHSVTGTPPKGWMSPRGTPSPRTGDLLAELGFGWHGDCFDSDTPYRETHPAGDLIAIPFNMEINDLPVCLKNGNGPEELLHRFRQLIGWCKRHEGGGLHIDVTVHAHYFGRPAGAWAYDAILSEATSDPEIWIATRSDIAEHFLRLVPR